MNSENPQKIFGIGLAKTATTSLCAAMTILGYKSKHYLTNIDIDKDIIENDFLNDMPIQTRYQEYDKKYPCSKFILTIRDKDSWLLSCKKHFMRNPSNNINSIGYKYRIEQMGTNTYDKDIFSQKYDEHIKRVNEYFEQRPDDLLTINITAGEGWDKLCAFLGKEIPKQPFPLKNLAKHKLEDIKRSNQAIVSQEMIRPDILDSSYQQHTQETKKVQFPTPRMSETEIELYTKYLQQKRVVVEFGSGGSTGLAIKEGVTNLHSVESDLEFIQELKKYILIQKAAEDGRIKFYYINIGPVGAWGCPIDNSLQENWPQYYLGVWKEISEPIDLVFIDGRFRVSCALQSLYYINKNTKVIIHDFLNRPGYHDILKFFNIIENADTMVVLQIKDTINQYLLSKMIEQYKYAKN